MGKKKRPTKTSVKLKDSELVEDGSISGSGEISVRDDLISGRGVDLVPVTCFNKGKPKGRVSLGRRKTERKKEKEEKEKQGQTVSLLWPSRASIG